MEGRTHDPFRSYPVCSHHLGLQLEDVLDPHPHLAFLPVLPFRALRERLVLAPVGAVRPGGVIGFVQQLLEALAVVKARVAGTVAADKLGLRVALGVVLVTEMGLVVAFSPTARRDPSDAAWRGFPLNLRGPRLP